MGAGLRHDRATREQGWHGPFLQGPHCRVNKNNAEKAQARRLNFNAPAQGRHLSHHSDPPSPIHRTGPSSRCKRSRTCQPFDRAFEVLSPFFPAFSYNGESVAVESRESSSLPRTSRALRDPANNHHNNNFSGQGRRRLTLLRLHLFKARPSKTIRASRV